MRFRMIRISAVPLNTIHFATAGGWFYTR